MWLADEIQKLFEEALNELDRLMRLELERVGPDILRWLDDLWKRMPCDTCVEEFDRIVANLARQQLFVEEDSRQAFIAWLIDSNEAAKHEAAGRCTAGVPGVPKSAGTTPRPADQRNYPDDLRSPFDPAFPQLRRAGNSIMQQFPPAEWLARAIALLKNYRVPEEIGKAFLDWLAAEQQKIVLANLSPGSEAALGPADDPLYAICFAAGTLVLTRRGQVAIESVTTDDEVWAVPESNPLAPARWCRVERTYHNAPAKLVNVRLEGGDPINATVNHPIFVRNRGFIAAQQLRPGDLLRAVDEQWVAVAEADCGNDVSPVYNLCVADCHTYFAGGVLVHNQSPAAPVPGTSPVFEPPTLSDADRNAFERWKRGLKEQQRQDFEEFEKQRSSNPGSTASITYFEADTQAAYLYASVAVVGAELVVTLRKGSPTFRGGNFRQVVTGSTGDRDSAQVAVRWLPGGQTATNVISGADRPKENAAARWKIDDALTGVGTVYGKATTSFDVPADATEVRVVLIYTDLFYGNESYQDAAGVVASWTGKKDRARWDFQRNEGDVMRWYGNKPDAAAVQKTREQTEAVLQDMGLRLVYRARHFPSDANTGYDISK